MGRRIAVKDWGFLAASGTAVATAFRVSDFKTCVLSIAGSSSAASLKVFIKGSIGETAPDFTVDKAQRSAVNNWDFIQVVDLESGSTINGDTGVNLAGNVIRLVEVNVNGLDHLTVHSTAIVAGTVTVQGSFYTNE